MKKSKTLKFICACLISVVSLSSVCYADTTTVSYEPSEDEIVPTEVKVVISAKSSEFGAIYDGDTELDIGEAIYQLKHGETKSFRIRPALGYDVYKVIYDDEDITSQLKHGRARSIQKEYILMIAGKGHNCELDVTYKKLGSDEPILPEEPDKPSEPDKPGTPDIPNKPSNPDSSDKTDKPSSSINKDKTSSTNNSSNQKLPENLNRPIASGNVEIPTQPDGTGSGGTGDSIKNQNNPTTDTINSKGIPTIRDIEPIYIYVLIVVIAGLVIITLLIKKRKEE